MAEPPADPSPLQFDRTESKEPSPGLACAFCAKPIADAYYEVGGRTSCDPCREGALREWNGGSGAGRFLKASLLGLLAAAVGTGLYYGVLALTGYEVGLIAIVVGLLVGAAVRKGSGGRGGWAYQLLAMFLTYTVVAASYMGVALKEMPKNPGAGPAAASVDAPAGTPAPAPEGGALPEPSAGGCLVAVVVLIGFAYAMPVLVGSQSILSIIIVGFALFEAWKLNKRGVLQFAGPFRVSAAPPSGSAASA